MIKKYKSKKPPIEAIQLTDEYGCVNEIVKWAWEGSEVLIEQVYPNANDKFNPKAGKYLLIPTLEGVMRAEVGDYVIKGLKGEFYPCKPDIFEQSYEEIK